MSSRRHAPARRTLALVAVLALATLTGCGDGVASSSTEPTAGGPPDLALLLPAVQAAREAARRAQSADGTEYELQLEQRLFADGRAVGTAWLVEQRSGARYLYDFRAGRLACEGGAPVVHLVALARATPARAGGASGGVWKTTNFLVAETATPGVWTLSITPTADDGPPVHAPLRLRAALAVVFSSDPCGG